MRLVEAADLAEVTYRQAQHWVQKGYVTGVPVSPGTGKIVDLYPVEVENLCVIAELVKHLGVSPEHAGRVAETLRGGGVVHVGPFLLQRPNDG